jgi:hypothetical protein
MGGDIGFLRKLRDCWDKRDSWDFPYFWIFGDLGDIWV